jgi:hypothetical protein
MGTKTQKLSNVVDQIVEWQSVFTGDGSTGLTAVAGRGYFIDTTSGTVTVTLPTDANSKLGDTIIIRDYAGTFATNNVTITSTAKISEADADGTLSTNDLVMTLTYVNSTKGWVTMENEAKSVGAADIFYISATGGTVTTSGDFKIHTFTGDGCFVVSCAGNPAGSDTVDYLVVAGGGGGGIGCAGAGGGAGGFRESKDSTVNSPHTASPLAATTGITVSATTYPITVGAGGAGNAPVTSGPPGVFPISPTCNAKGCSGSNSVFSTITSTGGGGGGGQSAGSGFTGGSGGGGGHGSGTGGAGNTPPVSPPQGNPGANSAPGVGSAPSDAGGGGGGATLGASNCGAPGPTGHVGGDGATTSISGSPTAYAGGGGGTNRCGGGPNDTDGGVGGGGKGGWGTRPTPAPQGSGASGTANTGGGGGGGKALTAAPTCRPFGGSGSGGKGIVILRYKFQ